MLYSQHGCLFSAGPASLLTIVYSAKLLVCWSCVWRLSGVRGLAVAESLRTEEDLQSKPRIRTAYALRRKNKGADIV
jgi:hypothetical protein